MSTALNDLQEIRKMMEKSSRFLSLSGLSGVSAGIIALLAATWAYLQKIQLQYDYASGAMSHGSKEYISFLIKLGSGTLILALISGLFFTFRKAKGKSLWNKTTRNMILSLGIPLLAGGLVIISMLIHRNYRIIPELTLIFYGLALVNASQHTYRDVYFLGLLEIALGVIALFINGYSLLFWSLGFGILHIIYGISMHYKYDRRQ